MKHVLRVVGMLMLASGLFSFGGCTILDPAEEIPSYLRINSISLTINNSQVEGSASHKITDAWVYVDGQLVGGFEMPVSIPILTEGTHDVIVFAGIKQNGLSTTRAIYSKYKGWEGSVTLVRGQIVTITPTVSYYPVTNFEWICDFEGTGTNINEGGPWPDRMQEISGTSAFEGESAYITLNSDSNEFYAHSADSFILDGAVDVYVELNYNCNQEFIVGLKNISNGAFVPWNAVQPAGGWNKIYIRLNDAMLQSPGGPYRVYFAMIKDPDVSNPYLYLDNIKLIN